MRKYPIPKPIFDTLNQVLEPLDIVNVNNIYSSSDFHLSLNFLKQYSANKATFESYRREIERLIQWSWLIEKKSILELQRQDIENYILFCLNPPKTWIGTKRVARFTERNGLRIPNPKWRPFVATVSKQDFKRGEIPDKNKYQLSQKAIREIFSILNSFYNYLTIEEKIQVNPVSLIRQKSKYLQKTQQQAPVTRLTEKQWATCLSTVKKMAEEDPVNHERTLFILSSLYLLYLRISELVASKRWTPMMKHFYQSDDGSWWFKVIGKGNKLRNIAVSDDMLLALMRYRENLHLTPLPSKNEKYFLLPKQKGKGAITDSRHIRRLIQGCFDKTIQKLREEKFFNDADEMESATVHWLRHTGISDDINARGRPITHVRDDAGHSSSSTTDRYNNIVLRERYLSAKSKKMTS